ncbi:MAG TPA: DUF4369 domain-containing protein [Salegentibacter sp.]|uniref:DUF4369 domain-containing protein n=1 Tax=Salegentibacter sp. TaxID=1903072 RepID=UPI002F93B499
MKNLSLLLLILIGVSACSTKESNLIVNTNIKGLKKGTVYLQKIDDTLLVNVDSIVVNGNSEFILEAYIESPQMMYLSLDKVDNSEYNDRLDFFGDKGEVSIVTTLEKFQDAKIVGSRNQEKLMEYRKIQKRFNDNNLDLIKESFEAEKVGDEERLMAIDRKYENLLKRRYLYTVNFAINNKDLELAPYLALSEVFDANIKYLDTIYTSLDKNVQQSLYGKELKRFLEERHEEEEIEEELAEQDTATEQE